MTRGEGKAIARLERFLPLILDSAGEGIVGMDREGRVIFANPAAARMVGWSVEDLIGQPMHGALHHSRADGSPYPASECPVMAALAGGAGARVSGDVFWRRDGTPFPVDYVASPIREDGEVLGAVMVFSDVTDRLRAAHKLEESRRFLAAVLDTMAEGVVACDAEGVLAEFNRAAREFHGLDLEPLGSERWAERYDLYRPDGETPLPEDEIPLLRAFRGEEVREAEMIIAPRDGAPRFILASGRRIVDADGARVGAVVSMNDVTQQRRAESDRRRAASEQAARVAAEAAQRRFALLAEVSEALDTELTSEGRLERLAQLLVPRLADYCGVYMSEGAAIRLEAAGHADPDLAERLLELSRRSPIDVAGAHPAARAIRGARAELIPQLSDAHLASVARDPEHRAALAAAGFRSAMILPLRARGRALGALVLISASERSYGPVDLPLGEELARRAALMLDNARLFERQSHIARVLQESLLPPALPDIPGVEVAARYLPAGEGTQVGGDFYDLFETGAGAWGLVIGDVCGKGPEAAALTALIRYTIRAGASGGAQPAVVLADLNDAIIRQRGDGRFCTAVYARLEIPEAGAAEPGPVRVRLACGGHPPPVILRADGRVERLNATGTLIGVFPDVRFGERLTELGMGDALILCTDGLTEARRGREMLGDAGLERLLRGSAGLAAAAVAERLAGAAAEFPGGPRQDDIAILVVRAFR